MWQAAKTRRRGRVVVAAALFATSFARRAHAEEGKTVELALEYDAPTACPSREVFEHALTVRSKIIVLRPEGTDTLSIHITAQRDASYVGTLALGRAGDRRRRELTSKQCENLVDAFAIFAALALDPDAITTPALAEPEPQPEPALQPPVEPKPTAPRPSAPDGAPPPAEAVVPPGERPRTLHASIAGSLGLESGIGPTLASGSYLGGELVLPLSFEPSLRLGGRYARALPATRNERDLSFSVLGARLDACPLRAHPALRLDVVPCATYELGSYSASASTGESTRRTWSAVGLMTRVGVTMTHALSLDASLAAVAPLEHVTFVTNAGVVHRTPFALLSGGLGLTVRIR